LNAGVWLLPGETRGFGDCVAVSFEV
jgi:hypothetical protein